MVFSLFGRKPEPEAPKAKAPVEAPPPVGIREGANVQAFRKWAVDAVSRGSLPVTAFVRPGNTATPPAEPERRGPWVTAEIDRTMRLPVTSSIYDMDAALLDAVSDHVDTTLDLQDVAADPDGFPTAFERMMLGIASRHAWLAATGAAADERIAVETALLLDMPPSDIAARFKWTPAARIDAVPAEDIALGGWIDEMLRGEAGAIASGLMAPIDVARAACLSPLPVDHRRPTDGSRIRTVFPAFHADLFPADRHDARARHFADLSRERVMQRFAVIPGFVTAADRSRGQGDWHDLIRRAFHDEEVRERSGLSTNLLGAGEVDLTDVTLMPDDDGMGFTGDLLVFGERACRLTGTSGGDMTADQWTEGFTQQDIDLLDAYIAANGEPRDDGETPDSLAARIADIVTTTALVAAYRLASENDVLFGIEDGGRETIHAEPVPEGRTRVEISAAYVDRYPWAVPLDDLDELDAVELWAALRE